MTTDAVIAWVDGSDPAHRQRLADYLATRGGERPGTAHPTRFSDAGEIDYCVASLLRFAPWLRTIHIVTDAQTPPFLQRLQGSPAAQRIRLVDHSEIFDGFEHHLPTFSSDAIGSVLWRIPGLAERFIYLNDDFMLLQPVRETDFFDSGKVLLRGAWKTHARHSVVRRLNAALNKLRGGDEAAANSHAAQEVGATLAGLRRRYLRLYHGPYVLRRSMLEAYFAEHPRVLERNVSHRLRSPDQFRIESLAANLEIAHGTGIVDNRLRTVLLKPRERAYRKTRDADRDPRVAFACVQSLDMAPAALQAAIIAWLDRRIGRIDRLAPHARPD